MSEKLLLVGSGGLGRVVLEHAIDKYNCSFVDDGYEIGTKICGTKVVGHINDLEALFGEYRKLLVTIGDNVIREKIYMKAEQIGFEFPNIICHSAYVSPFAQIGTGCVLLNNVCVQNGAIVRNGVVLNPGVEIHHDSIVDDYVLIYTNSVIRTMAHIETRAKIGSTCTISNNMTIRPDQIVNDGITEC